MVNSSNVPLCTVAVNVWALAKGSPLCPYRVLVGAAPEHRFVATHQHQMGDYAGAYVEYSDHLCDSSSFRHAPSFRLGAPLKELRKLPHVFRI